MSDPHEFLREAEETLRRALQGTPAGDAETEKGDAPSIRATNIGNVLSGNAHIDHQSITFNK